MSRGVLFGEFVCWVESVGWEGRVRVTKEHENVPNAELRWERYGVIEKREVPAGAVRCGHDVEVCLSNPAVLVMLGMPGTGFNSPSTYHSLGNLAISQPFLLKLVQCLHQSLKLGLI